MLAWRLLVLLPIVIVFLIAKSRNAAARKRIREGWPTQILVAFLSQVLYMAGTIGSVGLGVGTGTAAIIAALQPMLTGALTGLVLKESVSLREWLGLSLGLIGVLIVVSGDLGTDTAPSWAYLLPVLGMCGLVAGTFVAQRRPTDLSVVEQLSMQFLVSGLTFTTLAFVTGDLFGPHLSSAVFWSAIAWFVLFSILGGYVLYWLLLRHTSVTRVGSLIYLTPPTTAIWAWLMFGDTVGPMAVVGFTVVAVGVGLVFLRRQQP